MSHEVLYTLLPEKPGIYIFKDADEKILYVGKSRSLKDRVKSYFQKGSDLTPAKQQMVAQIASVEPIVTDTETEALLLEATLIKKYRPPYNIDLRDDKSYSYICIDSTKKYPEIYRVRQIKNDKKQETRNKKSSPLTGQKTRDTRSYRYFGPYTSGGVAADAMRIIKKYFPICLSPNTHLARGCFNYQIHLCPGACLGTADPAAYARVFVEIEEFLSGHTEKIVERLRKEIDAFAARELFEQAEQRKQLLFSVERLYDRQKVVARGAENADYVSYVSFGNTACVNILNIRSGALYDQKQFLADRIQGPAETILQVLDRYLPAASDLPQTIYTSHEVAVRRISGESFLYSRPYSLPVQQVQKGERADLLRMGEKNAQEFLFRHTASMEADTPIEKLCRILRIPYARGFRTEVYDVSHTQGAEPVGAMVVCIDSEPDKSQYRKFKLEKLGEPNDFKHMAEMLERRLKHMNWPSPNLIVIDGGKGQLSAAWKVVKNQEVRIPIIALAKREEEIYQLGRGKPLVIPKNNPALKLLIRARDEAHRFGITFHRKRRGRSFVPSTQ